ncbi:signal recognition particle-docking protein FtsY [Euzebya tangerina]|uniref:signal recognition particle-docking protein FtsY n=1 Tax=Euzebya tangerina TaxID=591198 RepID=UPI000E3158CA|nr:signal recognition particle-docking protein FtsY [Euzebya tangerina]
MELIIVLPIVAVIILIVVAGLFVGRRRGTGTGDGAVGDTPPAGDTLTRDDVTTREETADGIEPGPPDTDVDPYPGGPDLLIEDEPVIEEVTLTLGQRFRLRLAKASGALGSNLRGIFSAGLDEDAWEELEEALIAADVGVEATLELVEGLRNRVKDEGITDGEAALALLKEVLRLELGIADRSMARREDGPTVWLFTGVNGTGKTTSIGKLAKRHVDAGESVVLAAADTFRAAASEQLGVWGERAGARVVRQDEGADPAAVAFDGWQAASAAGADLLMIDTAGRLQNKKELMAELSKVKRVVTRESEQLDEVLLVIDATTGQNGLSQAQAFTDAVDVTGVVLTKLDGTAKGGIVIAIQRALDIPVKLVGLGEGIDDLAEFDPDAFIDALFAEVAPDADNAS